MKNALEYVRKREEKEVMTDTDSLPPLRILVVDDEPNICLMLSMCLESDGHTVVCHNNINDALEAIARQVFDLVFLDMRLGSDNGLDFLPRLVAENPWAKVVVITAYASVQTAVEAMKRGAMDYLPKPFDPSQVRLATQRVAQRRQLELKVQALRDALGAMDAEADLPTRTPAMLEAIELARRVAKAQAPILIRGEMGTGKGRLARAIHAWSGRADGPFATVLCRQSAEALEVELFGLTPANKQSADAGKVAFCEGGTLVLEEIGQAPPRLQAKLTQLIEDHEYERVDEPRSRKADVRVITTSSVPLVEAVDKGDFRPDLLLAIQTVEIQIPALRNRPLDIPLLAERYLAFFGRENRRTIAGFTRDAMDKLHRHAWPGNVRELRNVVERAVLLCRGETIGVEHLPPNLLNSSLSYAVGDMVDLETIERLHITQVVGSSRSLRRAAVILGIDNGTLCRKMKRYAADNGNESVAS
jgi:two-component system, NtrC family, response regulator AlgB